MLVDEADVELLDDGGRRIDLMSVMSSSSLMCAQSVLSIFPCTCGGDDLYVLMRDHGKMRLSLRMGISSIDPQSEMTDWHHMMGSTCLSLSNDEIGENDQALMTWSRRTIDDG